MNQGSPAPGDERTARRNYIVFGCVSALFIALIVLVASLFAAS